MDKAEVFHEVLEHRRFRSGSTGRDVGTAAAIQDYVTHVLASVPQELIPGPEPERSAGGDGDDGQDHGAEDERDGQPDGGDRFEYR